MNEIRDAESNSDNSQIELMSTEDLETGSNNLCSKKHNPRAQNLHPHHHHHHDHHQLLHHPHQSGSVVSSSSNGKYTFDEGESSLSISSETPLTPINSVKGLSNASSELDNHHSLETEYKQQQSLHQTKSNLSTPDSTVESINIDCNLDKNLSDMKYATHPNKYLPVYQTVNSGETINSEDDDASNGDKLMVIGHDCDVQNGHSAGLINTSSSESKTTAENRDVLRWRRRPEEMRKKRERRLTGAFDGTRPDNNLTGSESVKADNRRQSTFV